MAYRRVSVPDLFRTWWSADGKYDWFLTYARARGLARYAGLVIAAIGILIAVIPVTILLEHKSSFASKTVLVCAALCAIGWSARFVVNPELSRSASLWFVASADVGITLVCLQDPSPGSGLFSVTALALPTIYVTFLHGPKVLVLQLSWVLASLTWMLVAFVRSDGSTNAAHSTAQALVVAATCVGAPLLSQILVILMRSDAIESVEDPLTGLLNRRGLYAKFGHLLGWPDDAGDVVVILVDLDMFKQVNDDYGHGIGDDVLVRTARRIQSVTRGSAVLSRLGGEEFVLVDRLPHRYAESLAERIRQAISAPADRAPVTASIGAASLAVQAVPAFQATDDALVLDVLIERADRAMYLAKQRSRDTVVVDPVPVIELPDGDAPHAPRIVRRRKGDDAHPGGPGFDRRAS